MQFIQHAKDIGVEIDAVITSQNMPLPGFADYFARCIVAWPLPPHVGPQPIEGSDDRLAGGVRAEANVLDQSRQKATHRSILGIQLPVVHVVGGSDQGLDAFQRLRERGAWNLLEQSGAQLAIWQTGIQQYLAGAGQGRGRLIQIPQRAQARFPVGLDGVAE